LFIVVPEKLSDQIRGRKETVIFGQNRQKVSHKTVPERRTKPGHFPADIFLQLHANGIQKHTQRAFHNERFRPVVFLSAWNWSAYCLIKRLKEPLKARL
jgi:hypothetical protein